MADSCKPSLTESKVQLSPFDEVLKSLSLGKMIVLIDDQDREDEGDLVALSSSLSPDQLAFMMHQARGLICTVISPEIAERIQIPLQASRNQSRFGTPFGISLDHKSVGAQGVTAASRCKTIERLIDPASLPEDFVSPGSVFPLIANSKGVFGRRGQTEGSYDLARILGSSEPSSVICEILNPDGTMARGADLTRFCEKHDLKVTSVDEIARYRASHEAFFRWTAETTIQTHGVTFQVRSLEDENDGKEHLVLSYGDLGAVESPLVRIHSECLTGDVFGSRRCDCGPQLDRCLNAIVEEGAGLLVYLRQEGRGIGLSSKLQAYNLQDSGLDTVDANLSLGFDADLRDYRIAARLMRSLGLRRIRILTNNPRKLEAMKNAGFDSVERIPLEIQPNEHNSSYLNTKRSRLGHLFSF